MQCFIKNTDLLISSCSQCLTDFENHARVKMVMFEVL